MTTYQSSNSRADRWRTEAWLRLRALLLALVGLVLIGQLVACTSSRRGYAHTRYPDKPYRYDAYNPGYDPYYDPYRYDRDPYRDPYGRDPYGRDPYGRGPYDRDRVYVQPR